MPKYTLHYFAGNGRAVIPRAILCYAKADWTNHAFGHDEWVKIKKSGLCEFEQVPVLEVDGKKYSQSHAITLYLGETFNLLGKDKEENYQINSLLLAVDDINMDIWKAMFNPDEAKKAELMKAALEKSNFSAKTELPADGRYLILSTCAYIFIDARAVVVGRLYPIMSAGGVRME